MAKVTVELTNNIPGEAPVTGREAFDADDVLFMFRLYGRTVLGFSCEDNGLRGRKIVLDSQRFTTPDEDILAKLQAEGARMEPVRLCTDDHRVNGIQSYVNANMVEETRGVRGVFCTTTIKFYGGQRVIALEPVATLGRRLNPSAAARAQKLSARHTL